MILFKMLYTWACCSTVRGWNVQRLYMLSSCLWLIASCKADVYRGVVSKPLKVIYLFIFIELSKFSIGCLNALHRSDSAEVQHQTRAPLSHVLNTCRVKTKTSETRNNLYYPLAKEYLPLSFVECTNTTCFTKL